MNYFAVVRMRHPCAGTKKKVQYGYQYPFGDFAKNPYYRVSKRGVYFAPTRILTSGTVVVPSYNCKQFVLTQLSQLEAKAGDRRRDEKCFLRIRLFFFSQNVIYSKKKNDCTWADLKEVLAGVRASFFLSYQRNLLFEYRVVHPLHLRIVGAHLLQIAAAVRGNKERSVESNQTIQSTSSIKFRTLQKFSMPKFQFHIIMLNSVTILVRSIL